MDMGTHAAMLDMVKSLLARALDVKTPRGMSLEMTREALAILEKIVSD